MVRGFLRARASRTLVGAVLALPAPVLAGDWPDPSFIRDGEGYVAVTTSSGWAPAFRLLRSDDLRTWRIAGSAFQRAPRWAKGAMWAPELTRLNGGYAIFYSAFPRPRWWARASGSASRGPPWYCLGLAKAPTAAGPYRDMGRPLRCSRFGSIDPYPVRDERARLNLLWKEDGNGNGFHRPTPILVQRLSEDGTRLLGRPRPLIRNRSQWEGSLVEAPTVIRREGFFYLFYSANRCCGERCAYAVGVARSRTLRGRWEKYSGNPILRDGNGWRCPGHTSVVPDGTGGYKVLFHAYRNGAGLLVGRQLLADDVTFGSDGWPRIGTGLPAAPLAGAQSTAFSDSFAGPGLAAEWEWPVERVPGIHAEGGLRLRSSRRGGSRVDAGLLSRRPGTDRYVATAIVDRGALRGRAVAGLASYESPAAAIGVAVGRRRVVVWRRREGRYRVLAQTDAPAAPFVHLRLSCDGRTVRFAVGGDGQAWTPVGGDAKTPVEDSGRLALTAGGARRAVARFTEAAMSEGGPQQTALPGAANRARGSPHELVDNSGNVVARDRPDP